jgi:signal transduction histidine kinase
MPAESPERSDRPTRGEGVSRLAALGIAVFGDPRIADLDRRVLNGMMFLVALTGILSTVQNLVIGASAQMVLATVLITVVGAAGYMVARRTVKPAPLKLGVYVFLLGILIYTWITQAGSQGTIGYFFILVSLFATVLFRGKLKLASLLTSGAILVGLFVLEHLHPAIIVPYTSALERFGDVVFAVPLCLVMASTVMHLVYREYQRERAAKDAVVHLVTAEKERVERGMREKQRLLTVVSHDIANALTVMQGELSLTRLPVRPDRPSHAVDLDRIAYACANIEQIISSVHMMEAIEQGRITFQPKPVDLAAVFEYAEVIFGKRLARRRMQFKFPKLASDTRFVLAEPRLLANQVFGNLLSNAIKFSYPDSTIEVTVERVADETTIRVSDQGIGIPTTMLPTLFDLEAKTTRAGSDGEPGTGFGLRTVKHFVELFGGRLEISSRDEKEDPEHHGTTVAVRLKSARESARTPRGE